MTSRQIKIFLLSAVVSLTGFAVMAVYVSDFVSPHDTITTFARNVMSFSSALCLFLSGIAFYFIARVMEREIALAQVVLPVISLAMSIFIAVHLVSMTAVTVGHPAQMGESLMIESYDILDQVVLIHPSVASMVNFILFSIAGILTMTCAPCWEEKICSIGKVIVLVSTAAFVDRFLNLSHFFGLESKPIGLVSYLMFILLGAGLITVCRSK